MRRFDTEQAAHPRMFKCARPGRICRVVAAKGTNTCQGVTHLLQLGRSGLRLKSLCSSTSAKLNKAAFATCQMCLPGYTASHLVS